MEFSSWAKDLNVTEETIVQFPSISTLLSFHLKQTLTGGFGEHFGSNEKKGQHTQK